MLRSVGKSPSGSEPRRTAVLETAGPLYAQCAERLTEQIRADGLPSGAHLPSERVLAEALGFTRLTVRRALAMMGEVGVIEPARRGWRVADGPVSEPPNTLISFTEMAERRGLNPGAIVLSTLIRSATVDESDLLRVAPGSSLIEGRRVRLLDDHPIAIQKLRLSLVTTPWIEHFDWTTSLHQALESNGMAPRRSSVLVDVAAAADDEAQLLRVEPQRGLLRMTGTTFDGRGTPIALDDLRYHPDRYRFRATLERQGGFDPSGSIPYIGGLLR